MTIIERILLELSAKEVVEDGMPDFTNEKHLLALNEVLIDLDWPMEARGELLYTLMEKDNDGGLDKDEEEKARQKGLVGKGGGAWGPPGEDKKATHRAVDGKLKPIKKSDDKKKKKVGPNIFSEPGSAERQPTGTNGGETGSETEEETPLEVNEKDKIGTTDNWETEIKNSNTKLEKLQDALDKANKTGDEKKIAKAQKKLDDEIMVKEGLEMNQEVLSSLNNGSMEGVVNSQQRIENLRDKGIAGAGGKVASQGESRYVNCVNTIPPFKKQFSDKDDIKKVNNKKEEIKNRKNSKGKPNYPDKDEALILKTLGIDDPNSAEALEYFAKRELYAERELERVKNDQDSVFNVKSGFDGDENAYKVWMKTAYDGAMCTQEDIKNDSKIDTTKPHRVVQSNDRNDGHDQAIKKHFLDKYKEAKEAGDTEAMAHYKHQYKLMSKLGFHDTFAIGQDKNGKTTIYHISNKKATDISDPHNNTTPEKRIKVIKAAGFGNKVAIKVGQTLEKGLKTVSDVKGKTSRDAVNIPVDSNTAAVADRVLKTNGQPYLNDIDGNAKFQKWVQENGVSLESSEDKLKAIQQYIKSEIERTGKPPAYNPFGKIFSKIGEAARKKNFQKENSDIDFNSRGVKESIELKEAEKNAVKDTYQNVVNSITESDKADGYPDEDGNNGPHTQGYLETVFDAMHINTYIDNYDGDASIIVGGRSIKPRHIRDCLAEKTGYKMPPGDRKGLKEHLRKKSRIDAESGGIIVKGEKGEVRLFKDEWRSAGSDTQKVASYYEEDMRECMAGKVDADRKKNRQKNGLGK